MLITLHESLERANHGLELYDSIMDPDDDYFNEDELWEKHMDDLAWKRDGCQPPEAF